MVIPIWPRYNIVSKGEVRWVGGAGVVSCDIRWSVVQGHLMILGEDYDSKLITSNSLPFEDLDNVIYKGMIDWFHCFSLIVQPLGSSVT